MAPKISGLITALITPFTENGSLDLDSYRRLVAWQIEQGVRYFVLFGSTGEGLSLDSNEREVLFRAVNDVIAKSGITSIWIIVTASHPSTAEVIKQAKQAEALGAHAVLATVPCYVKPTQEGLRAHYMELCKATGLPIIIYNNPGRTAVEIQCETIIELAQNPQIIGLKDSTGDLTRALIIKEALKGKRSDFIIVAGDDENAVMLNLNGAVGCISVASNVVPKLCQEVQTLSYQGQFVQAAQAHVKLLPLYKALQCQANPVPIKYAAFKVGLIATPTMRLPLMALPNELRSKIDSALAAL